jgi:hypothetical protein
MGYLLKTRHRDSGVLLDYWEALRGTDAVPLQAQIQPRALKEILPQVFILDATDLQLPIYRLAGTGLCEWFGCELRGVPLLAGWESESQRSVVSLLQRSQTQLMPVCFHTVATLANFGWVDVETVLAPLAYRDLGVVRFIGAMQIIRDLPDIRRSIITSQRLVTSELARSDEASVAPMSQTQPAREWQPSSCRLVHSRLAINLQTRDNAGPV